MSNDTKRDVVLKLAKENRDTWMDDPECIEPKELIEQDYQDWIREYDAALPDELPVIPEDVAYVIKQAKKGDYKLGWVFYATYSGIFKVCVGNWIRTHADMFSRAWLDGYQVED